MRRGIKSADQYSAEDPLSLGRGEKAVDFVTRYHKSGNPETFILPNSVSMVQCEAETLSSNSLGIRTYENAWPVDKKLTSRDLYLIRSNRWQKDNKFIPHLVEQLASGRVSTEGVTVSDAIVTLLRCIKRGDSSA